MSGQVSQRRLGRSGLVVSRIALGTMLFGDRSDETEAGRILSAAAEAGVNFIDTADTYADGRSEEIVGRLLKADRDRFVLATKLGNPNGAGPNRRGLSRRWIVQECHASLRRLGLDHVDILYLHKDDYGTPQEETVRALADLIRSGAIRYFGVSNMRGWRIARIASICDAEGIDRPVAVQPLYHCLNRTAELEVLPAAAELGLGVVTYSPVARGVLSGKYAGGAVPPPDSRAASGNKRILETEYRPENLAAAAAIAARARALGIEPTAFAVAWILANPIVTAVLAGPRTLAQWTSYLAGASVALGDEEEAFVSGLVAPGTTAVPHYVDPAYPPTGRTAAPAGGISAR